MKKIIIGLHFAIIGISFSVALWQSPPFSWVTFWNAMFTLSLLLLLIGMCMYILSVGFFDVFVRNFKYFMQKVNRAAQIANEIDKRDNEVSAFIISSPLTKPFIITGGTIILISTCVSIIL